MPSSTAQAGAAPALPFDHSSAYRVRRFLNWFPLGLAYAFLYMGRYNLTVAKGVLGQLMTKEDFGVIFAAGTLTYGISFIVNGPLTDRIGGRRAMLIALVGSLVANVGLGLIVLQATHGGLASLTLWFSIGYSVNMYFQSFAAVAIVKVNSAWFHVRERGAFSGIFGTMISSGIYLAFTGNDFLLRLWRGDQAGHASDAMIVFFGPAALLFLIFIVELIFLRDLPSQAGHQDFDTGAAKTVDEGEVSTWTIFKRILTHPIIFMVALIEFCTGVLRQGIMHWTDIYSKEVLVLPDTHLLRKGSWGDWWIVVACFAAAVAFFVLAKYSQKRKAIYWISGALAFLAPFFQGGWGGLLFVAGVIGGNVAGWVSDLFFQSRRAPAAGGLYALMSVCVVAMYFVLGDTEPRVAWVAKDASAEKLKLDQLQVGDTVVAVGDKRGFERWPDVARAIACLPTECTKGSRWEAKGCKCTGEGGVDAKVATDGTIPVVVKRDGAERTLRVRDPVTKFDDKAQAFVWTPRAGDSRVVKAGPVQILNPLLLGIIVFLISTCVIGTHGLLSGTASQDFGGKRGTATAVGIIDGFVYLGTGLQSIVLGFLTSKDWSYWPLFMAPFAVAGFLLTTRIWHAKPRSGGH